MHERFAKRAAGPWRSEPASAEARESAGAEVDAEINLFETNVEENAWEYLDEWGTEGEGETQGENDHGAVQAARHEEISLRKLVTWRSSACGRGPHGTSALR